MGLIDILEEIIMTYETCTKTTCTDCPLSSACIKYFGVEFPNKEIKKLADKCSKLNEFARANRKEGQK